MAKKEENPLFVGITSGDELRRSMLGCSKSILESLKEYENFKSLREEKSKMIHNFKGEIKDILKLINKLKLCLPKVKEVGIRKVGNVKVEKAKVIKVEKPKARTELERLESELNDIESKLSSLG